MEPHVETRMEIRRLGAVVFPDIQGHVPAMAAMTDPSSGSSVCRARVARSSAHETVDPKAETRS